MSPSPHSQPQVLTWEQLAKGSSVPHFSVAWRPKAHRIISHCPNDDKRPETPYDSEVLNLLGSTCLMWPVSLLFWRALVWSGGLPSWRLSAWQRGVMTWQFLVWPRDPEASRPSVVQYGPEAALTTQNSGVATLTVYCVPKRKCCRLVRLSI